MRTLVLVISTALTLAGAASSAMAATVRVAIAPELREKAVRDYGLRDVQQLAEELRARVDRSMAKAPEFDTATVELVLTDVKPSRPTQAQMTHKPALSFQSVSLGGAAIEGGVVRPNGTVSPIAYQWYETDIRQADRKGAWSDARWAIERFAAGLPSQIRRAP